MKNLQFLTTKLQHIRNYRTLVTVTDQQEVPYALSTGTKVIDLGWPWMVDMHLIAEKMHLLEPKTKISVKINLYMVRWATTGVKQRKVIFFTECSVIRLIPQISWVVMTQRQVTLKDICGYLMLENFIGHVCGTHIVYTLCLLCFLNW